MQDFEKLGAFYLGRPYDLATKERGEGWLLYDSRDLVTHAVCVGMTGSGKTGLCLCLLEEAAIDGIPAIVIDPKGDLGNLLLTFPDLQPADFAPWVNPDDARRKGVGVDEHAAQQAALWRKGLAEWGEDGARIARLRAAADFAIYTPGSEAGLPVSILRSLDAPTGEAAADAELVRDRIATTATSLLGLLGRDPDPVKSRDHILLSTLLDTAWRAGRDMDLATLIQQIQSPPVSRIGVFDLEAFYPARERFELAMTINNLLASPAFASWMSGDPLDIQSLLYTKDGRPRIAIFSIAHLGDAERMFFVSLLLQQTVGWMRTQSGTTSLRALVYMDEIMGYFPPVANPPSKAPLMTLLKQGRAFGVGVVLATQNPVDIDYKGLSNAGTWFLGRLQTERDKARVIEGLEGAAATAGAAFDRQRMEATLAALGSRIFLMNNVHDDQPVVFETRWALSYLRGPLGRQEIKRLMSARAAATPAATAAAPVSAPATAVRGVMAAPPAPKDPVSSAGTAASTLAARPVLGPGIEQYFLPPRGGAPAGSRLVYAPALLGTLQVRYADAKVGVDHIETVTLSVPVTDAPVPVDWSAARESTFGPADLEREPAESAVFDTLPAPAAKAKTFDTWRRDLVVHVYGTRKLSLLRSVDPPLVSKPGETEGEVRTRLQQAARERRDQAAEQLRQRFAPRLAALQERLRRAEAAREREASQASAAKMQTAISFGATLLGAFVGRKTVSASTLGRAATAARGVGRSMKEAQDVKRAAETVEAVQQQIDALEAELQEATSALESRMAAAPLEPLVIAPKKTNITVQMLALTWMPWWEEEATARRVSAVD